MYLLVFHEVELGLSLNRGHGLIGETKQRDSRQPRAIDGITG